jgi:hypothetical protein
MKALKAPRDTTNRVERQWTQKLQEQARNWQSAKLDERYLTDRGVPVIRRHKRRASKQTAA